MRDDQTWADLLSLGRRQLPGGSAVTASGAIALKALARSIPPAPATFAFPHQANLSEDASGARTRDQLIRVTDAALKGHRPTGHDILDPAFRKEDACVFAFHT